MVRARQSQLKIEVRKKNARLQKPHSRFFSRHNHHFPPLNQSRTKIQKGKIDGSICCQHIILGKMLHQTYLVLTFIHSDGEIPSYHH